jgi:hypothetical protein
VTRSDHASAAIRMLDEQDESSDVGGQHRQEEHSDKGCQDKKSRAAGDLCSSPPGDVASAHHEQADEGDGDDGGQQLEEVHGPGP